MSHTSEQARDMCVLMLCRKVSAVRLRNLACLQRQRQDRRFSDARRSGRERWAGRLIWRVWHCLKQLGGRLLQQRRFFLRRRVRRRL